jgi:hypothetical protein
MEKPLPSPFICPCGWFFGRVLNDNNFSGWVHHQVKRASGEHWAWLFKRNVVTDLALIYLDVSRFNAKIVLTLFWITQPWLLFHSQPVKRQSLPAEGFGLLLKIWSLDCFFVGLLWLPIWTQMKIGHLMMKNMQPFPIRTDCVTIFLWLEVVPSDGIGILPLICAWPPRGCTI